MGTKRNFSVEYKKDIIKLVTEQGRKATHVAKEIGVSEGAIRKWVKEYGVHGEDAFSGKGKLRPEDEELRKFKKRMADIEEENAIFKKAICIFTKPVISYQFIKDHSSKFHAGKMCELLDIKRSSYYAWLKRPKSQRKIIISLVNLKENIRQLTIQTIILM